jgi:SAM-dependent methyltransferase
MVGNSVRAVEEWFLEIVKSSWPVSILARNERASAAAIKQVEQRLNQRSPTETSGATLNGQLETSAQVSAAITRKLEERLRQVEERLSQAEDRLEFETSLRCLDTREATARSFQKTIAPRSEDRARPADPIPFHMALSKLQARFPKAYPIWRELFDNGRTEYENVTRLEASLSIAGNPGAEAFRKFLVPYLNGHVLDIGCGPQPLPIYLEGTRTFRLAGLDPLPENGQHEFEFVQGLAEFIPWPDQEFDTVVAATSLDHVLSLDMAIDQILRVLRDDGRFVVWVGFVAGSPRYEPDGDDVRAVDEFHMFHFDRVWFEELMHKHFVTVEKMRVNTISSFYVFKKAMCR